MQSKSGQHFNETGVPEQSFTPRHHERSASVVRIFTPNLHQIFIISCAAPATTEQGRGGRRADVGYGWHFPFLVNPQSWLANGHKRSTFFP
jgi:hypothetical protein